MTGSKKAQLMVGLFFLGSVLIFAWLLLFLKPSYGDGKKLIRVRFTDIERISQGTRVTLAGKPIGEVQGIVSIANARDQEPIRGAIFNYELHLSVDSSARIFPEDLITSQTAGLLGERTIVIIPQRFEETSYKMVDENDILYAQNSPSVEEALEKVGMIAAKVERTIDHAEKMLAAVAPHVKNAASQLSGALSHLNSQLGRANEVGLVDQFSEMSHEVSLLSSHLNRVGQELFSSEQIDTLKNLTKHLERITTSLDRPKEWDRLFTESTKGLERFNQLQQRLIATWPKIELGIENVAQAANQVNRLSNHGMQAMQRFDQLSARIAAGKGTLGRLIMDDHLYLGTHETLARINILLSDINNYGVLFHNSRKWRNARMGQLANYERLRSPAAFQNYYQGQVDEIYLSIGRLRELMEATSRKGSGSNLARHHQFDDIFTDLVKKIKTLGDQLALLRSELITDHEGGQDQLIESDQLHQEEKELEEAVKQQEKNGV